VIEKEPFGELDGTPVHRYAVTTTGGLSATFIDYGACLVSLHAPDREGVLADVVLGFDDLAGYLTTDTYCGATCGRYGNRIAGGRFVLDGAEVQLDRNEGDNHVHGGREGFDRKVWSASYQEDGTSIVFTTTSAAGEMGFPGALTISTTYEFDPARLRVTMEADTDAPTLVNLVHHSYFNLAGHGAGDVLAHELTFASDFYTPVDDELLATGEILSVAGTPFDFRAGQTIGSRIAELPPVGDGVVAGGDGYDHNWCLRGVTGELHDCALVHDPATGRIMRLRTTEPGVQLYTGGELSDAVIGKGGVAYRKYAGFTLETQKYPGSPNFSHFPSARVDPGRHYRHEMIFDFSTDAD
jgi:aldose 1-epimerase